jgi:hypothetical protein
VVLGGIRLEACEVVEEAQGLGVESSGGGGDYRHEPIVLKPAVRRDSRQFLSCEPVCIKQWTRLEESASEGEFRPKILESGLFPLFLDKRKTSLDAVPIQLL